MWDNTPEERDENVRKEDPWYETDRQVPPLAPATPTTAGLVNKRNCAIGALILAALICIVPFLLLNGILDGGNDNNDNSVDNNDDDIVDVLDETDDGINLGNVVSTSSIDREGCANGQDSNFGATDSIYVVAEESDIPAGTDVFVRLYLNGNPIEDAPEITADRDYEDTCVNFVFEPETGTSFDAGQYEAQFMINGNPSESVSFTVQ